MITKSLKPDIIRLANEQYGTNPEYLWKNAPEDAILRHRSNRKWYAVIMTVAGDRIGLPDCEDVDIINVKLDPMLIGSLQMADGFIPAYHMNKENWISILLDGTVDIGRIADLLDMSYEMTGSKNKAKNKLAVSPIEKIN